jgi:chondroitin AC lyase
MLHNRKRYDFSVRAVSKRTCRSESGNGENLWGTYVSEGATNIRVSGDEYVDIFPVWEWDKIPGTTTPVGEVENHNEWGVAGVAEFVGGVSDGMYGVMTYAMNDYNTQANKGWFMFDNEIMCLGTGIASTTGKTVNTSVNQCHLVGDVYMVNNGQLNKIGTGNHVQTPYQGWIWHNKVAYYYPDSVAMNLKNGTQSGKWSKVNFNQSGDLVTLPVFNMWIDHGVNPKNEKYAYMIMPGIASPASLAAYDLNTVKILSNTAELQVVHHNKLDILQAIFYAPGELKFGDKTLKATKPCVVMVKKASTPEAEILVNDPTQKEEFKAGVEIMLI